MSRVKKSAKDHVCDCAYCKKPDWLTPEEFLREVGQFLGYPKCCIEARIADNGQHPGWLRLEGSRYKGKYTSFIPCEKHAKRVFYHDMSLARIIRGRKTQGKFPIAWPIDFERYLKLLKKQYDKRAKAGSAEA